MKRISCLLLVCLSGILCSFQISDILYDHYAKAIRHESTFQFYFVIQVKNLNTGETKEICTSENLLRGAIHREFKIGYDDTLKVTQIALNSKNRYFEFKNDSALWNVGFNTYSSRAALASFEKQINFDSIVVEINKKKYWSKQIHTDPQRRMYAHVLFNRGILTGENNCYAGKLIYIDDKNGISPIPEKVEKMNYQNFSKNDCEVIFGKYKDSKKAKELLCQARYNVKNQRYATAIYDLKNSYKEAKSREVKFQIIKATRDAYSLMGDTTNAQTWQLKVDKILSSYPDIDQ